METFELVDGYDRTRKRKHVFRNPANVEEMDRHCSANSHIWFLSNDGTARKLKINGRVRRWKRDAERIEVPIKYGMYETGTFYRDDISRVLIMVEER